MSSPILRLHGLRPEGNFLHFIHMVREATGFDLLSAKKLLDQFRSEDQVAFPALDHAAGVRAGETLQRLGVVRKAELLIEGQPPCEIPAPPPPPLFACPDCRTMLTERSECSECGWLRFPSDRNRWGAERCPKCGFKYRYDGAKCSHCGHGTSEQSPLQVPLIEL